MNNNMNNFGSRTPQRTVDFSRPPPGYSVPTPDASRVYRSPQANRGIYPGVSKKDVDYTRPEVSSSDEPRSSYSRWLDVTRNVAPQVPRASGPSPRAVPTLTPPETPASLDPRLFNVPPPLPPAEPYAFNIAVPPGGYILSSTVYAIPGPPPPGPPPQAPPPPQTQAPPATMGAGHYATQQPGNFRQQQFQGEYSPGYPKRNGVNNQLNRKRTMPQEFQSESPKRSMMTAAKKKKKPLSQNMPAKKDWSLVDAKRALDVEREFNKRNNRPSLIIKFPDLELNREIVSNFHPKIESVHFQKPSTQRYCFVTLKGSSCMEEVINELSKVKFGQGYLSAELKHNKDDDMVKGPEDIDPLTLYVGNLAQEVTVEDVVKAYPKHKRIDIGFAKKMKYTRYAFVCFRTVDDAIEAFQNTHATEMYHQSLIVRFRRLHGTVGMPGDPKPQNPPRQKESESSPPENVPNPHNPNVVITKCDPETEAPEFTAANLFEGARVKSEPFDNDPIWDFPSTGGDDYLGERTHVPFIYKVKDDPDNMLIKQEVPEDLLAPGHYTRVGNGDDSSEDECLISSTSYE